MNEVVVKSFTYDMAGRTTGITDSGGTTTLSYDYEDRLVSISRPGVATNTFAYNGFGARVSKTDSSGSNTYLRASSGLIGSIVADSGATYTPGVSEKRGTTSTFYHSDIKNTVEQTSTGQGVAASKQYDAFGNEVSSSGSWQGPFQYGGAFGYHTDSDYGLKHLGARYYDPTTGRFLSRDPIKDGRNWYAYARGNPVQFADPTGLFAAAAAAAAAGSGVLLPALAVGGALLLAAALIWWFVESKEEDEQAPAEIRTAPGRSAPEPARPAPEPFEPLPRKRPIIIGETQDRVDEAAEWYNAETFEPSRPGLSLAELEQENYVWISRAMTEWRVILDIGEDETRRKKGDKGYFYEKEREWTRGYPLRFPVYWPASPE